MGSLRLTNAVRDRIIAEAVRKWEKKNPPPDMQKAEKKFADAVYRIAYGKYARKIKALPTEFFNHTDRLLVRIPGRDIQVQMTKERAVPWDTGRWSKPASLVIGKSGDEGFEEYKEFDAVRKADKEHDIQRRSLVQDVQVIMASANTLKQLIELWPEAEGWLTKLFPPKKEITALVPAGMVQGLNKKIDLP